MPTGSHAHGWWRTPTRVRSSDIACGCFFWKPDFDSLQQLVTACWATACCPDVLRVLRDLRFEHGFSPMHWSAQRGRRDLIEFIRQQVASASAWRMVRTVVGVDKIWQNASVHVQYVSQYVSTLTEQCESPANQFEAGSSRGWWARTSQFQRCSRSHGRH